MEDCIKSDLKRTIKEPKVVLIFHYRNNPMYMDLWRSGIISL
jgi:hypothetical protein